MPHDDDTHTARPSQMEMGEEIRSERSPLIPERIVLEAVQMNLSGQVATAVVRLLERVRRVSSRSVGHDELREFLRVCLQRVS